MNSDFLKCKSTDPPKKFPEDINPIAVKFVPRSAKKNLFNHSTIKNPSRTAGGLRVPLKTSNVTIVEEKPLVTKPEDTLTFNVDDPYDPADPTDYYEYLQIKRESLNRLTTIPIQTMDYSSNSKIYNSNPAKTIPSVTNKHLNEKNDVQNAKSDLKNLSRVIILCNMVGRGEVDVELEDETSNECKSYGVVKECKVHEIEDSSVPDEQAVRIFVFYETSEASGKAIAALNNRYFAGRQIKVHMYPESAYLNKNYELVVSD